MKLNLPTTLPLALLSLLTSASAQTVQTVLDDITALDQDVQHLTAGVSAYQGGLLTQTPLLADLTQVHLATQKGYHDSELLPAHLTVAEASSIIDHVNETLAVDNPKAVKVLMSKKSLFQASGTDPAIADGLKVLLNDHLDFSDAVLERTPASLKAEGQEVVDVITRALEAGIADFSS